MAGALSGYLGAEIGQLRALASGWETTLYEFEMRTPSARLPGAGAGASLVLRLYANVEAAGKGALEYRMLRYLAAAAYPVPRPYLFEPGAQAIGAPFLVMQRLDGGPLFAIRSFPQAFRTFSMGFPAFVRAQARLHRMKLSPDLAESLPDLTESLKEKSAAADGALAADGRRSGTANGDLRAVAHLEADSRAGAAAPLLERTLDTIAARVAQGPLPGLDAPLGYLRRRAPEFRDAPQALLHLDYHPQNVLVQGFHVTGIIDWAHAAIGDRHYDAATTAVMLSTSAMEHPRWMRDNAAGNNLRRTFNALYLALYHAIAPMDLGRLRYYQAVAATLRLSMLGMMRRRGPQSVGFRAGAISEVTPSVLRLLTAYVARKTGTAPTVL